jgi:hypothetical protein
MTEDLHPAKTQGQGRDKQRPSADELGEPTLIIVIAAALLMMVWGVWLLGTVTSMWVLALVMVVETACIIATGATIYWQLSDGPGRRIEDQPPSTVRTPRPRTPTT